jgi:hypothetical protein
MFRENSSWGDFGGLFWVVSRVAMVELRSFFVAGACSEKKSWESPLFFGACFYGPTIVGATVNAKRFGRWSNRIGSRA